MTPRAVRLSKFLSLVLRHDPARIGLRLDPGGWADVDELLVAAARSGVPVTRAELEAVVRDNPKQRFTLDAERNRIRANQGHSLEVDLGLTPLDPPDVLFHGTSRRVLAAILAEGLRPVGRRHVHLSADARTAMAVGGRHGPPVVLAGTPWPWPLRAIGSGGRPTACGSPTMSLRCSSARAAKPEANQPRR